MPDLKLSQGDRIGEGNLYEIRPPDGKTRKLKRGERLTVGGGGAGKVYCAIFRESQLRAVKFLTLNYLDDDKTGRREADFRATFRAERDILYRISHANIAKLHDSGTYVDESGNEWEYLVTEFVAGPMLKPAFEDPSLDGEEIYRLLGQILNAVRYLHMYGVYHGDIKHENIKLRRAGRRSSEAVLLDLGTAHALGHEDDLPDSQIIIDTTASEERYRFISTWRITHDRHRPYLGGRLLSRLEMLDIVPAHDLHSLGILFRELLGAEDPETASARERLRRVVGDSGILVFDAITLDLLRAPDGNGYASIEEVVSDFEKLHPNYLSPAGTPELSLAAEFQFSLLTATGRGTVTPRLGHVLNHKLVQRLREISQLEYTSLKFPGATHTRFSHSTAVLRNSRYYLAHLLNDARFRRLVEPSDLQATLLLALLHDVGHYQLSHMFEDFATDQRSATGSASWVDVEFDIPTDDDLFLSMVTYDSGVVLPHLRGGYGQRIESAVRQSRDFLGLPYWETATGRPFQSLQETVVEEFGEATFDALVSIHTRIYSKEVSPNPNPAHLVLGAVISSDVDADKTAYLVEDSARSGVPYGHGVDLDGILGALCMPSEESMTGLSRPVIGLIRSGVTAAQSVAVNRNAMLTQVYWNRANRAATAMVKFVIARLLQAGHLDMPHYIEATLFASREECLMGLFREYRNAFPDREIVPIAGLLAAERRLYKKLFETASLDREDADEISDRLVAKRYDEIIDLEDAIAARLRQEPELHSLRNGEIVMDVPTKERERASGERGGRVYVYEERPAVGRGEQLAGATPILQNLKEQHRRLNRVCRVFIAPHRYPSSSALIQRAAMITEQVVRASVGV